MINFSFDHLVSIYRALAFDEDMRKGTLRIESAAENEVLLHALSNTDGEYGLSLAKGDASLGVGVEIVLNVEMPRIGFGLLSKNLDHLLEVRKARLKEPKNYFLIQDRFSRLDEPVPEHVVRYRKVLELIQLFKESAAYLDEGKAELIFVDKGKFELPLEYFSEDVQKTDIKSIEKLVQGIENDTHKEQKLSILAAAVVEISQSSPPKDRFRDILARLPELSDKFSEGYRLFASSFSYQNVRDELETAKVEYTVKIHKVFSDIQNQILTIPVATIIVATQMKAATNTGYEFWVNTGVLVGCYVFVLLMAFVISNQVHTLNVLDNEIVRQKNQMQKKYKEVFGRFSDIFTSLEKRVCRQKIILIFIAVILSVGLILSHIVYFSITTPAKDWANQTFSIFTPK